MGSSASVEKSHRPQNKTEDEQSKSLDPSNDMQHEPMEVDPPYDSPMMWECPQCTFANISPHTKCAICDKEKPTANGYTQPVASNKQKREVWLCKHCNLSNILNEPICTSCGTPQGEVPFGNALSTSQVSDFEPTIWRCKSCDYNQNPPFVNKCDICNHSKKRSSSEDISKFQCVKKAENDHNKKVKSIWTCSICTYENSKTNNKCDACGNNILRKENKGAVKGTSTETPASATKWKCKVCTYENNAAVKSCHSCGRPQSSPVDDVTRQPSGSKWRCASCTLLNRASSKVCELCAAKPVEKLTQEETNKAGPSTQGDSIMTQIANALPDFSSVADKIKEGVGLAKAKTPKENAIAVKPNQHKDNAAIVKPKQPLIKHGTPPKSKASSNKANGIKNTWSCSKCTYENPMLAAVCEICQTTRAKTAGKCETPDVVDKVKKNTAPARPPPPLQRQKTVTASAIRKQEEQEILDQLQQIEHFCKENNIPFVDDSFPHAPKSVYYHPAKRERENNREVAYWLRPPDIRTVDNVSSRMPWALTRTPCPTDIQQGVLGNCWFLSALAVIAERPELIEMILVSKQVSEEGVYQLRLCKDGTWTHVLIDDSFPCDQNCMQIYSQAKRKQLWVSLIEKALAKSHGCYEALASGRCLEGLSVLTGAPCESLQLQSSERGEEFEKDIVWATLLSSRESKFLMGGSCGSGNMKLDDAEYTRMGLKAKHAYSILDVQNVPDQTHTSSFRLIRLRNPWGRFSWSGDWSDNSVSWNQVSSTDRQRLMPLGEEEGIFWMALDDLIRYFDSIDICKYRPDWMEVRVPGDLVSNCLENFKVTQIEVFNTTEVDFGLFQEGTRSQKRCDRSTVDLCVVVMRSTVAEGEQLNGTVICHNRSQVKSFVGCSAVLEPGTYTVVPLAFNHWTPDNYQSFRYVLAMHSSKALLIDSAFLPSTVLADTVINLAIARGDRNEGREGMTTYYLTHGWSGFIIVVENRLPHYGIDVQCDCEGSFNVVSTRATLTTKDVVPPLHRQVLLILSQLESSDAYSVTHRLVHRTAPPLLWGQGAPNMPPIGPDLAGLHAPRPL